MAARRVSGCQRTGQRVSMRSGILKVAQAAAEFSNDFWPSMKKCVSIGDFRLLGILSGRRCVAGLGRRLRAVLEGTLNHLFGGALLWQAAMMRSTKSATIHSWSVVARLTPTWPKSGSLLGRSRS